MQNLKSKRFVIRKSLIGKNQIIEVTFKMENHLHTIMIRFMK